MQGDGGVHRTTAEAEPQHPAAYCVLWRSQDSHVPDELSSALAGRSFQIIEALSSFAALAELCFLERILRAAHPFPARRPPVALLIHEPSKLPDKGELVRAVERYATRTHLWLYAEDANTQHLRRVLPEDARAWDPPAPAVVVAPGGTARPSAPPRRAAAPNLRLAGEGPAVGALHDPSGTTDSPSADDHPAPHVQARALLSPEELELLLADDASHPGRVESMPGEP